MPIPAPEQQGRIVDAYKNGMGVRAISKRQGFSRDVIYALLKKHNIKRRADNATPENIRAEIIAERAAGAKMRTLAKKYGVGLGTIHRIAGKKKERADEVDAG